MLNNIILTEEANESVPVVVEIRISNIILTEVNDPDSTRIKTQLNNIVLAGKAPSGIVRIVEYGSGAPIEDAIVKVFVDGKAVSSSKSDAVGRAQFDYRTNKPCTLLITHEKFEQVKFDFFRELFEQFNEMVSLVPRKEVFVTPSGVVVNLNSELPTNQILG